MIKGSHHLNRSVQSRSSEWGQDSLVHVLLRHIVANAIITPKEYGAQNRKRLVAHVIPYRTTHA